MKKIISILLVVAVMFSLGVTAFAKGSPVVEPTKKTTAVGGMGIFDSNDKQIAVVPPQKIVNYSVANAGRLPAEDKDAFLAAYEEAKNVQDRTVRSFFWLDIPDEYKNMDGFAYAKYNFNCRGENVQLTVNGNPMEVVNISGSRYFAKLTEFGAVSITSD